MKKIALFLALAFFQLSYGQGLKLKEFKPNTSDGSAFHAPKGNDGHPCGLIKVRSDNSELNFSGDIVGEVENKMNEYWIYMSQGSNRLTIKTPHLLPLEIKFDEYGIERVASKTTYIMVLQESKYKEKNLLTISVSPVRAKLYIDNMIIDNNDADGIYKLYLPKGQFNCRVEKEGYRPNAQIVSIGKAPQILNVVLESLFADVDIACQTGTADIVINGEKKGVGGWKGQLLPGKCTIEAIQEGYESYKQELTIQEKDKKLIKIPALERVKGTLNVKSVPSGCKVVVDKQFFGYTPCIVTDLLWGKHHVVVELDSLGLLRNREIDVDVVQKEEMSIGCQLATNEEMDCYQKAFEWFKKAEYYPGSIPNVDSFSWFDKIVNVIDKLEAGFFLQEIKHTHMGASSYWKLGVIMVICYSGESNSLEKQITIAEKMERKSWEANQEVADSYERMGNKKKAIEWYEAALRVLQLELDVKNDDADRLQIIRDTIIESINECKN